MMDNDLDLVSEPEEVPELTPEEKAALLMEAAKAGDAAKTQELLQDGATVAIRDDKGWSPLVWAAFCGHDEVVAVLLQHGADADYVKAREAQEVAFFEEHGAEVHEADETPKMAVNSPLHWAVFKGHIQVVWRLLLAGFSVHEVDENGNNALHLAATCGKADVIRAIMSQGVDIDAGNGYGNDAYCVATTGKARALLRKARAQKQCPQSGKYFGGDVLRYLCACSGLFYTEECTVAATVHASVDEDILKPVRYSSQAQERINEAQDKLHEAMHPTAAVEGGAEEGKGEEARAEESKGSDEQADEFKIDEDAPAVPAVQEIPLTRVHLAPLEEAIEAVQRVGGDIRLVAAAEKSRTRLLAQIKLEDEIEALRELRPLKRRTQAKPLANAAEAAAAVDVDPALISEAKTLVTLAVAECKLRGSVTVCKNISLATHAHDGDMKRLSDAYEVCSSLGGNPELVEDGRALFAKLQTEVGLYDQVNAVNDAKANAVKVIEDCLAATQAPDYEFPLIRPEPIEGPDGEMVPPPSTQMSALINVKDQLDALSALVEGAPATGASMELIESSQKTWAEEMEVWKEMVEVEEERGTVEEAARVKLEKKLRKKNKKKKKKG